MYLRETERDSAMKIKHVEELVGITKKNIRFYEEQGLLSPGRAENGYREYTGEDVRRLKQIKFLRKLAVPIEEIRRVLTGELALSDCLERHIKELDRQKEDIAGMQAIASGLLEAPAVSLDQIDIDTCLEDMTRSEKEGRRFMNIRVTDTHRKKAAGALLAASVMIGIMALIFGFVIWGNSQSPIPTGLLIAVLAVPAVIIICILVVLAQRIKEIEGGEEDEAAQY